MLSLEWDFSYLGSRRLSFLIYKVGMAYLSYSFVRPYSETREG